MNTLSQILIALAAGGGGSAIVAFIRYIQGRPENIAKARKVTVESEVTLSDGYEKLLANVSARLSAVEKELDTVKHLLEEKDHEIASLKAENVSLKSHNADLTQRVDDLEEQLKRYEHNDQKIDAVTHDLHESVDHSMSELK